MNPLSDAEVAVDESSDEEDIVEEREGDNESEQDISENEHEGECSSQHCFIGKDGTSKWNQQMRPKSIRTRQET